MIRYRLGFQTMLKEIVGQEKIYDDSDSDGDCNDIEMKCESENNIHDLQTECKLLCT